MPERIFEHYDLGSIFGHYGQDDKHVAPCRFSFCMLISMFCFSESIRIFFALQTIFLFHYRMNCCNRTVIN
jgi:hypothetical protein